MHADRGRLDALRDAALGRVGYRVVRIPAQRVASNIAAAVALISAALATSL